MANTFPGLTAAEVADRLRRGLGNRSPRLHVREYAGISARNLFTGFNAMVAPAAIVLFSLGDFRAAVAVSGMAILNTGLSLIQEIRAKIHLDRLSLLSESKVRVRRDAQTVEIPKGEVVQDDCVLLQVGDTVVADGPLLECQFLEIDEALLTGESDPVRHPVGARVLSGSVCVAGEGIYRAEAVGAAAFAQKTATEARRYHAASSPLTRSINRIVQFLSYTAILLCLVHFLGWMFGGVGTDHAVRRIAATITTMVPQGLVLASTLSFIVGALAMGRRGAVVQQLSAIETMAAVDVVCTDKTGTLTTNQLTLEWIRPLLAPASTPPSSPAALPPADTIPRDPAAGLLAHFASASVDRNNRNIHALRSALGGFEPHRLGQIPFKSRLRYSAVLIEHDHVPRLLVLGAVEALRDRCHTLPPDFEALVEQSQHQGLRLLLFAELRGIRSLDGATELPSGALEPIALIAFADELRPDAGRVLEALNAQGISFKVISGDNPETVQGTVRHLNLPIARDPVVSGRELADTADPTPLIRDRGIFGRIAPEQKVTIVETLKAAGHKVAMIGDGVNDILPIKHADLGIAMGSGSPATKTVAGLVLEGDRFELLPAALEEGRTIVRNLRRSAKLFLVKNVYSLMLILATYMGLGIPFPYVPQQVTLLNWSVIGIPALAIAMSRQKAERVTKRAFLPEVLSFALRTGVLFAFAGIAILRHAVHLYPGEERLQRSMFLSMLIVLGITTLFRALADGEPAGSREDRSFKLLGLLAAPVYLSAMYIPALQHFFELAPLGSFEWLLVAIYAAVCWAATLFADRFCRLGDENK